MTYDPEAAERLAERLYAACSGHPHAKIAWPHRLLHDAAALIRAQAAALAAMDTPKGGGDE